MAHQPRSSPLLSDAPRGRSYPGDPQRLDPATRRHLADQGGRASITSRPPDATEDRGPSIASPTLSNRLSTLDRTGQGLPRDGRTRRVHPMRRTSVIAGVGVVIALVSAGCSGTGPAVVTKPSGHETKTTMPPTSLPAASTSVPTTPTTTRAATPTTRATPATTRPPNARPATQAATSSNSATTTTAVAPAIGAATGGSQSPASGTHGP
jgi:hypothetical protein